jgi:hypothetical protein
VDKAHDSHHSLPSSVDVNVWSYTTASPHVFIMRYFMKRRDGFASLRVLWDFISSITESYKSHVCLHKVGSNWDLCSDTKEATSRLPASNLEYQGDYSSHGRGILSVSLYRNLPIAYVIY